jgi:hypothetical protein
MPQVTSSTSVDMNHQLAINQQWLCYRLQVDQRAEGVDEVVRRTERAAHELRTPQGSQAAFPTYFHGVVEFANRATSQLLSSEPRVR